MNIRSLTMSLFGILTAWGVASCGGGEPAVQATQPSPKVRTVRVTTGRTISDTVESTASIVVEVRDSLAGTPRPGVEVQFSVLDVDPRFADVKVGRTTGEFGLTSVDTTNSLGQVNARLKLGSFIGARRVVAAVAALAASDTASVTVKPGAPTQVRGVPLDTVVLLGAQYRQGAEALDRFGNAIGPVAATLSTTTPSICAIDNDGTIRGIAPGICLVRVSSGSASQLIQPRVVPTGTILVRRGTVVGTLSLDGTGFTKITDVDTIATRNFQWLGAGREIAFWEPAGTGQSRLVISDMAGVKRQMPALPYAPSPRRLSDDGNWLVVALADTTNFLALTGVARMRSDGSSPQTLISKCCIAFFVRVDISADGSRLAFSDYDVGYYVNFTASKSSYVGEAASLRFSPDGTQLARVIANGALIGQDVGAIASPSHDIDGGSGRGRVFDQTAGWSPDSKWILAGGSKTWWVVASGGGLALQLPISIGSTYVVLDGWKR
jgi:hypothetical protein